ncbi:MAG: DUF1707 and DUF2154 domain-containing protein [Colwellia sp.]|nr:DUF1707 and DUF2154 domain-containing protein [Colwellia sp.]
MSIAVEDRPIEAVRAEVIDQLIMNYSHGELSYQAFERRLDQAMESHSNTELIALAADLTLKVDKAYTESKKQNSTANFVPGHTQDIETIVNVFSGSTRSGGWKVPKELRYYSIFSGCDIDFSEAQFSQPVVRIKIFSLFSGDTIYVPENINVVSKAFCIFGGIDNSAPCTSASNAPTIIIEGVAIFSGVTIKVKRTIKEQFVNFADSLKKMFS